MKVTTFFTLGRRFFSFSLFLVRHFFLTFITGKCFPLYHLLLARKNLSHPGILFSLSPPFPSSLLTPPSLQDKGLAALMINEVVKIVKSRSGEPIQKRVVQVFFFFFFFSFLFSPVFYYFTQTKTLPPNRWPNQSTSTTSSR